MTAQASLNRRYGPLEMKNRHPDVRNRELGRCAVLAANIHNTQAWLRGGKICGRGDVSSVITHI